MTIPGIEVRVDPPYRVVVESGALALLPDAVGKASRVAVLTDDNVEALYASRLGALAAAPRLSVAPGEGAKSLAVLGDVLEFLVEADLDRHSVLVAFGGGVIGDLGGLAASLFMRGIDVVQCPTTLLAMVDAAVGGKTAINLTGGKNLAGTFHQPRAVLADPTVLSTLPAAEYLSGLGEVIKTALIGDVGLLDHLERNVEGVDARNADLLGSLVVRCVRVKAGVVARDEREGGERKTLNLGHTFAHGIERTAGYGVIPHGVAVAAGLCLALRAAEELGLLEDPGLPARITALLERLGLAPSLAALRHGYGTELPAGALIEAMRHDKKGGAGEPAFVVPHAVARLEWDVRLPPELLASLVS